MEDLGIAVYEILLNNWKKIRGVCLVTMSNGEHGQHGHSIQGKFPTNLKCHLKTKYHDNSMSFRLKRGTRKLKKVEGQKGSQLHQHSVEHK